MSDEQAPEGDRTRDPRTRPAFLPPLDERGRYEGYPPPPYPTGYAAPADPAAHGSAWNIGVIVAGAVLLVSAFLPWAQARISIDLFGRVLTRDLGSVTGLEADNVVVAVPVLAMIAIAMAFWGIIGRDTRSSALAAIPGALSLLVCGLFVLRLDQIKDRLADENLSVGYEVAVITGWYLAVAMSLLVIGFSLARPLTRRLASVRPQEAVPAFAAAFPAPDAGHDPAPPAQGEARPEAQPQAQWPQEHWPQEHWPQEHWPREQPQKTGEQGQWPGAPGAGQS